MRRALTLPPLAPALLFRHVVVESITKSKGAWFAGAVTVTFIVAACHDRPFDEEHTAAPRDSAVQLADDGSGPRRVAPEPLVRTLGNAGAPHAEEPEPHFLRGHARIRMLARPRARLSLTIAPASLAPWLAARRVRRQPGSDACTVSYPAFRPEVLSIGALGSGDAATPYASLPMWNDGPADVHQRRGAPER